MSSPMTVKKYRRSTQPSKTSVESTVLDDGNLFDIPDSSPNSPTERALNSDTCILETINSSPDLSGFHLNLAEANQDIFTIPDSRSPSPIYIDGEDNSKLLLRNPSPAPSGLDSNLADANQDIFAISDSRSPSPTYIDTEDMFIISDSPPCYPSPAPSGLHLMNLAEANQDVFAIPDSRAPSPIYIDTENMLMISDSPPLHPSPAPSKHHPYFTEVNQDIFAIQDSPSLSPKHIDTEDMFTISDSPQMKTTFSIPAVSSVDNQSDASFSIQRIKPS